MQTSQPHLSPRPALAAARQVEDFTVLQDRIGKLQDKSDELREHIRRSKEDLAAKQAAFAALPPLVDNTAAMEALREECDKLREQVPVRACVRPCTDEILVLVRCVPTKCVCQSPSGVGQLRACLNPSHPSRCAALPPP